MQHLPTCGLLRFRLEHEVQAYNLLRICLWLASDVKHTHRELELGFFYLPYAGLGFEKRKQCRGRAGFRFSKRAACFIRPGVSLTRDSTPRRAEMRRCLCAGGQPRREDDTRRSPPDLNVKLKCSCLKRRRKKTNLYTPTTSVFSLWSQQNPRPGNRTCDLPAARPQRY